VDTDDIAPPPRPKPPLLDTWSIAELEAHIKSLEAEIARTREIIQSKQSVRAKADGIFRT
jgi:uncharacterized small protein (DUF1192 family)